MIYGVVKKGWFVSPHIKHVLKVTKQIEKYTWANFL